MFHLYDIFLGGKHVATIADIVKVSGVSRSTVFRFFNGNNVRADAKKSIMQAMEQLNYRTDMLDKYQNIVIEISVSNDFESFKGFTEVIHGIMERADERGICVQIARRTGAQIEKDYKQWQCGEALKGVVVIGKSIEDEQKEIKMVLEKKIPHIFVNRVLEEEGVSYVAVDLKKAAYDMVKYLMQKGHKNIAICGDPQSRKVDFDKLQGYKKAFEENKTKVSQKLYREVCNEQEWEEYFEQLLQKDNMPDAFLGICDSHAMKFIYKAQQKGYKVPQDIVVVGMDDIEMATYFKPALTTVHVPFKKMGIIAVESLVQLITDDQIDRICTIIKHTLVFRQSCGRGEEQLTINNE